MRVSTLAAMAPFYKDPFPPSPPSSGEGNAKLTLQPPEAIESAKAKAHEAHFWARQLDPQGARAARKRQRRHEGFVSKCLGLRWTVTPESYSAWLDSTPEIPF